MVVKLSDKEIEILQFKRKGLKNKQIAEMKGVSEPDISQTLSRITKKITSIQDVFGVLQDVGVFRNDVEVELTESGRTFLNKINETRPERVHLDKNGLNIKKADRHLEPSVEFNVSRKTGPHKRFRVQCPCGYGLGTFNDEKAAIVKLRLHVERFHMDFLPFGITNAEALTLLKKARENEGREKQETKSFVKQNAL